MSEEAAVSWYSRLPRWQKQIVCIVTMPWVLWVCRRMVWADLKAGYRKGRGELPK